MSRTKEITLTGTEVVVQDNKLIETPRSLTLQEQKLFLFLVSKLDPNRPEDITFRLPISEYAKAIGVQSTTDVYRDVRKSIKRLMSTIVTINQTEEGERTTTDMPILGYAKYWHGQGYLDVKISVEIAPYLFHLRRKFTQYKLSQVLKLSSFYTTRIYELLKSYETIGKRTFFIDDLRKKLSIKPNQYERFSDLKSIIERSKQEINDKTDLVVNYSFQKTGRKFDSIEFSIHSKDEETEKKKLHYFNTRVDVTNVRAIMSFGYSAQKAKEMLAYISNADAKEAIRAAMEQIEKGNVKNPKGLIKTALEEGWRTNERKKIVKEKKEKDAPIVSDVSEQETKEPIQIKKWRRNNFLKRLGSLFGK